MKTQAITCVRGAASIPAVLRYEEAENGECQVEVEVEGTVYKSSGEDYFDALCGTRRKMEASGLLPYIYGASKNVWPSPMSRSMGGGLKAYKMEMGKQALMKDLVAIFESGPDVQPTTLAQQEQYRDEWFSSLCK